MIEMRTTERLQAFRAERADEERSLAAIGELQRRGDTLVQARDLEMIVRAITRERIMLREEEVQALSRLERELGGG